jgi:creatinine amidohydrolase/Fe(II)-dependent formamide hydrolase-like protein
MEEFVERLGVDVRFYSYWSLIPKAAIELHMDPGDVPSHGLIFETSIMLAMDPTCVRMEAIEDEGAKRATAEKGRAMIRGAVEGVVGVLREMMGERVP